MELKYTFEGTGNTTGNRKHNRKQETQLETGNTTLNRKHNRKQETSSSIVKTGDDCPPCDRQTPSIHCNYLFSILLEKRIPISDELSYLRKTILWLRAGFSETVTEKVTAPVLWDRFTFWANRSSLNFAYYMSFPTCSTQILFDIWECLANSGFYIPGFYIITLLRDD